MKSQSTLFQGAKRLNNVLLGIETFFMALITIALVAAIFIEVICRYFLFISAAWAEELTRYLFIWLTYIGSAYAVYEGSHTEIDVLKQVHDDHLGHDPDLPHHEDPHGPGLSACIYRRSALCSS